MATKLRPRQPLQHVSKDRLPVTRHIRRQAADKQRLENMNAFHDSCDCIVVPVYKESNWVGKAEYERLRTLWDETVKKAATNPDAYKATTPGIGLSRS